MAADTPLHPVDGDMPEPARYPDAPDGAGIDGKSDLDRLTAIADTATDRTIDLPIPDVPGRSGVRLRFQVGRLSGGQMRSWQKTARKSRRDNDIDGFLFNALLVANTCEGILVAGQLMVDSDGDPYQFRSADFMQRIGTSTAADAARKFIGSDGVIGSLCETVMADAGFGSEVEPDPTGAG